MNMKGKKSRNEIILHIFLYGGLVCFIIALLLGCVVPFLIRDFLQQHPKFNYNTIVWASIILTSVVGAIFCLLLLFLKVEKTKKPPTIIKSPAFNYEQALKWFQNSLAEFTVIHANFNEEREAWTAKTWKIQRGLSTDYRILLRMNEATEEKIDDFLDAMYAYFKEERQCGVASVSEIEATATICVDRVTPAFKDFLNYNNQRPDFFILVTGISFGSCQLYYVPSIDGIAPTRYKKLVKRFLDMLPKEPR